MAKRGVQNQRGLCQTYYLANSLLKSEMEMKEFGRGEGVSLAPLLDLPLIMVLSTYSFRSAHSVFVFGRYKHQVLPS